MKFVAGVDLGGTNTKIGIVSESGQVFKSKSIKTISANGMEDCLTRIYRTIKEMVEELKFDIKNLDGIGIGIPGPVERQEIVGFFANFPWGDNVDVATPMRQISGLQNIKLDNDVNVIALGEAKFGAGKGTTSSVTIALGTGIGGGIYVDGNIISGFKGGGGEVGHIKIERDGKLCGCGQHGCFEAYASATGLVREAVSRLMVRKDNLVYKMVDGNLLNVEAKTIFDAAKEGDKFALELIDYEAEYLAQGISIVLNLINPQMLILGGGVAQAGDILLNPVKEKLARHTLKIALECLKIKLGELGNDAGIIGAAGLVVKK